MPRATGLKPTFLAHVVPGLESIAAYELMRRFPDVRAVRALAGFDERASLIAFAHEGPPAEILGLRAIEDLFVVVAEADGVGWTYADLRALRERIEGSPLLETAIPLALARRGHRPRRPTFRVVTRMAGEHTFRRADLQEAVEKALLEREPNWRLVEEDAHLEVWAQLVGESFVAAIRLSDAALRQRAYKVANLPASLKPTIAAAMALVSRPRDDDVVLDPMCGAGTLLIERAELGRYAHLYGGDLSEEAVEAARMNVGRRYKPIDLQEWDARRLPLDDASIAVVLCNLPFGKRIFSPKELRTLYPALIAEWSRVLAPGGRMVLLTSETGLLAQTLKGTSLELAQRLPVIVRGLPAAIHLVRYQHEPTGRDKATAKTPGATKRAR